MDPMSMSVSAGAPGGRRHNVLSEYRDGLANVDASRTGLNEVLRDDGLEEVYEELFGEAVRRYDAGQRRRDRRVGDYLAKVRAGRQERASYELVVQVGNRDTNPATEARNRMLSSLVYRDWLARFEEEFPHFRVVTAAVHVDEATPHLHVEYVPWADGQRRGPACKNSLRQAMRLDGYADVREMNARLMGLLEECGRRHGVKRLDVGCERAHMDVRAFKAMAREDARGAYAYTNDPRLVAQVQAMERAMEEAEGVIDAQGRALRDLQEVCHNAGPFNVRTVRQAAEDAQDVIDRLYTYEGRGGASAPAEGSPVGRVKAAVRRCKAILGEIPRKWVDYVLNPITDRIRASRGLSGASVASPVPTPDEARAATAAALAASEAREAAPTRARAR